MNNTWKDITSSLVAVLAAVAVFAKLQGYSWLMLGSWRSALGALAVLGAALFLINIQQFLRGETVTYLFLSLMWVLSGTLVISFLFSDTTKAQFLTAAALLAATWLIQLAQDMWDRAPSHKHKAMHA